MAHSETSSYVQSLDVHVFLSLQSVWTELRPDEVTQAISRVLGGAVWPGLGLRVRTDQPSGLNALGPFVNFYLLIYFY